MKKLLTFSAAALMTLGASAQSLTNPKLMPDYDGIYVIPRELSYDGTNRIVIPSGADSKSDGADQYTVYSNDFNEVKTIQNAAPLTEYASVSIMQKEVVSAQYNKEQYKKNDKKYIAAYLTFDSEPTQAEMSAALTRLGYPAPEEELYNYRGYECYVLERKDSIVSGHTFSYPTKMVYLENEEDSYKAYLLTDVQVFLEVYNEDHTYMDLYFSRSQAIIDPITSWSDNEIKAYINDNCSDGYFYVGKDYEDFEEVKEVTTDPNGKKWFVFYQETIGKFILNRAGFVLADDGVLYLSYYEGDAAITYGGNSMEVYSQKTTKRAISYGSYGNYDAGNFSTSGICISQKLFNDDAQYEYITFTPIVKRYLHDSFTDGYWIWDGETEDEIEFAGAGEVYIEQVMYNGMNIVSETGNVLASVSFPADFLMSGGSYSVFVLEGNTYLSVNGYLNYQYGRYSDNQDYATLIYRVTKSGTSSLLSPVSEPVRISVNPTLVGRDEPVTISAGENVKRDKHVRVVDMQGRVMQQGKIPAGQKSTQVHHLPQGMNFVQVMEGNQTIHTQPVIVK